MDLSTDPGIGYLFRFTVDGQDLGMFTQVSGLNAKYDIETIKEGGENTFVHQLPGRVTYENIKLKRSLDGGSPNLAKWFNGLATNMSAGKGTSRHNGTIVAFGPHSRRLMTWNLRNVFPVSYKGPSFQAGEAKVLTEELELGHTGFDTDVGDERPSGRAAEFSGSGPSTLDQAQRGVSIASNSSAAGAASRAKAEVGGLY